MNFLAGTKRSEERLILLRWQVWHTLDLPQFTPMVMETEESQD